MKQNYLSKKAAGLSPYTPGEQPQGREYVKLNTNENPYPPSPQAAAAIADFDTARLRKYPDPESLLLRKAIADGTGLSADNIFCGNGSDEILALAFQAFFNADGKAILFPDVTYSFYKVWCALFDIPYRTPALDSEYKINLTDYTTGGAGGIVIANPNAPTGITVPRAGIEAVLRANPDCVVIVDEAYSAFSGESALPLIGKYPNLCVVQTFSKCWSLAGLRAGFAAAAPELIDGLKRIKDSFNSYPLDMLAQAAAAAAFADREYTAACVAKITAERERFSAELKARGFEVLPSGANFVFARLPGTAGEEIYLSLKEGGVLVRWFRGERTSDFLRITIGTPEEMSRALAAIDAFIGKR